MLSAACASLLVFTVPNISFSSQYALRQKTTETDKKISIFFFFVEDIKHALFHTQVLKP